MLPLLCPADYSCRINRQLCHKSIADVAEHWQISCGSVLYLVKRIYQTATQACRIAKLFAKHMKLPEQQKHLESHVVGVGCGTPNRLLKLADTDALRLDRLRLLVLDMQLDAKQR